jgi:hypothetical protein
VAAKEIVVDISTIDHALHQAPVIHVDGAAGFVANNEVVKFNLVQDRLVSAPNSDREIPIERVVCARLVMSPSVFKSLVEWVRANSESLSQIGQ